MSYSIKETYYTLQGEGANTGRPAVFCRFSGCNLWTGREEDRSNAICQFCDTDFVGTDGPGGGQIKSPEALAEHVDEFWPESTQSSSSDPLVVCTGGEPLLQLDAPAVEALHARGFEVAVETNGTQTPPGGLDWICMSPKAGADLKLSSGDELKLVYPQEGLDPTKLLDLNFDHFFLQPKDGPQREQNTQKAVKYCLEHPVWRLSLQTHKYLGLE